jgi:hypothetical protein
MSHATVVEPLSPVRIFPAPHGCARLVAITSDGTWVQERLCLIEDVTPEVLEQMKAVVRQHEA